MKLKFNDKIIKIKNIEELYKTIYNLLIDNRIEFEIMEVKEGKTNIGYMPCARNVIVSAASELDKDLSAKSTGLILSTELSDKDKVKYGGTSKSADVANKTGEEQEVYELIAVGSDSEPYKIGDKVLFRPGCQPTAIKVDGKFYLQLGVFEILGLML